MNKESPGFGARGPGAILLSPIAIASMLLVVFNDLYLKRHDPGLVSGKLSDVGLVIFLPLFLVAATEWVLAAIRFVARIDSLGSGERFRLATHIAGCVVAVLYFGAIKSFPWATHAHEAWLSFVMPRWHFRAVTDPTDLLCLPAIGFAWLAMRQDRRKNRTKEKALRTQLACQER